MLLVDSRDPDLFSHPIIIPEPCELAYLSLCSMSNMSLVFDLFEVNTDYTEGLKLACDDALSLRYAVSLAICLSLRAICVHMQRGRHGGSSGGV